MILNMKGEIKVVKNDYTFGKPIGSWHRDRAQTVTFVVTNDCNLRCKYCYITHKSPDKQMNFETAKAFIDLLLASGEMKYAEAVILEFIGGEPLIEVELVDRICDYFKLTAFKLNHDWYWNYRISICTNGVNYSNPAVQNFIHKNLNKMSIAISLDGTKEKHDMQRVFPDGSGSYDIINKSVDLWLSKFRGATKVTFASSDLPLLYDSIISLWNRGIKEVNANVVFEDVWKDGDDKILEEQLKKLADYVIDNELFNKGFYCSFFDDNIGAPYKDEDMDKTYCGAGKMIALAPNGKIYPCLRYYGYSLNKHEEWSVGNIQEGIDMEKVRPFVLSTNRIQSDEECLNCEVATGCGFCQGFNYDEAPIPTNFYRAKYICKMHKARVRANEYYFSKLYNRYNIERTSSLQYRKQLYFLTSDDYVTYCSYKNENKEHVSMDESTIIKGLEFARQNFFTPIFVHSMNTFNFINSDELQKYDVLHIVPAKFYSKALEIGLKRIIPVYDMEAAQKADTFVENVILNIHSSEIEFLSKTITALLQYTSRMNLNITGLDENFNEKVYRSQMEEVNNFIFKEFMKNNELKEVNLLTDILFINKHDNCMAGDNTFVLSPGGKIYTCCAEYSNNTNSFVGDLSFGVTKEYGKRLHKSESNNLCRLCDTYQCKNCVYTNKLFTKEVNVSPSFQCRKSNIERGLSIDLLEKLKPYKITLGNKEIKRNNFLDPMGLFMRNDDKLAGYYKFKK